MAGFGGRQDMAVTDMVSTDGVDGHSPVKEETYPNAAGFGGDRFSAVEMGSIAAVVAQLPIASVVFSPDSAVIAANDECRRLLGYESGDLVGLPVNAFIRDAENIWVRTLPVEVADISVDSRRRVTPAGSLRLIRSKDGTDVSCWMHVGAGVLAGRRVFIACMDLVTPMVNETHLWRSRAERDDLTGLYRRTTFFDRVERWIEDERFLILAFIDVDNLKYVNDTHGHSAGDRILKAVAHRLVKWLPPDALVGRFAGDEFVLALSDADGALPVDALCASLRDQLCGEPVVCRGVSLTLSVSIGAVIRGAGEDCGLLVARADQQMYEAKTHHQLRDFPGRQPAG